MPNKQHSSNSGAESQSARISEIQKIAAIYAPPRTALTPLGNRASVASGQVWLTLPEPEFPDDLPKNCATDDPFPVVILDRHEPLNGHQVFTVAPVLTEIEMAGPDDLILPPHILGFEAAVAVGSAVGMLADNLAECRGALPANWHDKMRDFRRYLQGIADAPPPNLSTGDDYLDTRDLRYRFHEQLVDRLDYLQAPYVAWLERCVVIEWEAEEARGSESGEPTFVEVLRIVLASFFTQFATLRTAGAAEKDAFNEYDIRTPFGNAKLAVYVQRSGNNLRATFKLDLPGEHWPSHILWQRRTPQGDVIGSEILTFSEKEQRIQHPLVLENEDETWAFAFQHD